MEGFQFTFRTDGFLNSTETLAQNVNGFAGKALADWLSGELRARGLAASEVWPEDHGWDFSVVHGDARYLCACIIEEHDDGAREGDVIVHKTRSLMDKLLGRNKFTPNDAVAAALRGALAENTDVRDFAMA